MFPLSCGLAAAHGLTRRIAATVPLVSLVSHILLTTDLVTIIGRRAAQRIEKSGAIACASLPFPVARWRMAMLSARRRDGDAGLRWLRDRVRRLFDEAIELWFNQPGFGNASNRKAVCG